MDLPWSVLETGADGRWCLGIGDPTWLGWVTVAGYAAAAYLALAASRKCAVQARKFHATDTREVSNQRLLAAFWLLVFGTLAALGINKQLDLQSLFTQIFRDMAREQGWYEDRRKYQVEFIVTIAIAGGLGVGALAYVLRRVLNRVWLAVIGLGWIVAFVLIRAASFHHVDLLLRAGPVRWNGVCELTGIAMIGVSAYRSGHAGRADRTQPAG